MRQNRLCRFAFARLLPDSTLATIVLPFIVFIREALCWWEAPGPMELAQLNPTRRLLAIFGKYK